ncbi:MAG: hypothetical protein Q8S73_25425 [Deltaproteobacteria bacterium]|nr:hypothetical protein [Myxococcales bacterium]MDP3217478.1 hypothetical protein [Deltaproteobacteria bacterium]
MSGCGRRVQPASFAPESRDGIDRGDAQALVGGRKQHHLEVARGLAAAVALREEGDARDDPGAALRRELVARPRVLEQALEER